jgi:hypothetical protein
VLLQAITEMLQQWLQRQPLCLIVILKLIVLLAFTTVIYMRKFVMALVPVKKCEDNQ